MRPWWAPQSSKLSIRREMDGRFDSDTFPLMMRVILAILCLAAWAPSQTTRLLWNGYDWQRIDRLTAEYPEYRQPLKRAYVQGLLDAKLYYFLQSWAVDTADAGVIFRDYLNRFTIDQLVRGTDMVYQDPANRYLPVISALAIATLRATGSPDSVVAEYTQASRDWISTLEYYLVDKVPVAVEGISRPLVPKLPGDWAKPPSAEPRRWYFPEELRLP